RVICGPGELLQSDSSTKASRFIFMVKGRLSCWSARAPDEQNSVAAARTRGHEGIKEVGFIRLYWWFAHAGQSGEMCRPLGLHSEVNLNLRFTVRDQDTLLRRVFPPAGL